MKASLVLCSLCLLAFTGCATTIKRGHIVMKTSNDEAHVAMGSGEVRVGDHVELYHNQCTASGNGIKGAGTKECHKVIGGHGEVTTVINDDYSTVKFPPGTQFAEGDTIEKHSH